MMCCDFRAARALLLFLLAQTMATVMDESCAPEESVNEMWETQSENGQEKPRACLLQVARSKTSHATPHELSQIAEQRESSHRDHTKKVLVEIFYETKCAFCEDLLNTTLREVWDDVELRKSMDVKLYPFGNAANLSKSQVSKGYHFWHPDASYPLIVCQHGEAECLGNRIHVCASDVLKDNAKLVPFVICMASYGTLAGAELTSYECGKELNISMKEIKECVDSKKGLDLIVSMAANTRVANISHVPWVLVNGKRTNNETLLSPICGAIVGTKPKVCPTDTNHTTKGNNEKGGGSGPCLIELLEHM